MSNPEGGSDWPPPCCWRALVNVTGDLCLLALRDMTPLMLLLMLFMLFSVSADADADKDEGAEPLLRVVLKLWDVMRPWLRSSELPTGCILPVGRLLTWCRCRCPWVCWRGGRPLPPPPTLALTPTPTAAPEMPPNTLPVSTKPPLTESPDAWLVVKTSSAATGVSGFLLRGQRFKDGKRASPSPQLWQVTVAEPPPSLCASMNVDRAQDS